MHYPIRTRVKINGIRLDQTDENKCDRKEENKWAMEKAMQSEERELIKIKEIIDKVSNKYDKIWKKRNREIDSKFLVSFIFQKITNKNFIIQLPVA